jgi:hypothetical protein
MSSPTHLHSAVANAGRLRKIALTVGAHPMGTAYTWSYPDYDGQTYVIPTYELKVTGQDESHRRVERVFEVLRFGVHRTASHAQPHVVGVSQHQSFVIHDWIPTYKVHSFPSREDGAWQVHGNYLIHDGPDDPQTQLYATAGCIEICGGPNGFVAFNQFLVELAGTTAPTFEARLRQIGRSGCMTITYVAASPPPVLRR